MLYPRERSQLNEMLAPVRKWEEILFLRQTVGERPGENVVWDQGGEVKKKGQVIKGLVSFHNWSFRPPSKLFAKQFHLL